MTTTNSAAPTSVHVRLLEQTSALQQELLDIPFCQAAVAGTLTCSEYVAFLGQAYHHVKHTVPLLMAAGAACGPERRDLQDAFVEYIEEERGHDLWILDDIRAAGGDADVVRDERPGHAADVLVAYAYDTIRRRGQVGFLGMVHALEGTSVHAASGAAVAIQATLGLPDGAFTYLTSHGALDVKHVAFFEQLVDTLDDPAEQTLLTECSERFFRLYGDVFRGLSPHSFHNPSREDLT